MIDNDSMKIGKGEFYIVVLCLFEFICMYIAYSFSLELTCFQMAIISILQIIFNLLILKFFVKLKIISIPNLFALFAFIFHCGQFIKMGFNIEGTDYFPLNLYAANSTIQQAFYFYIFSQIFYTIGVGISSKNKRYKNLQKLSNKLPMNAGFTGKLLVIIGLIPRLFIDIFQLYVSSKHGYMALFTSKIPQFVNSLAFFFDTGFIFLLMNEKNKKKSNVIFGFMIFYKSVTMLSGSRQDKVCFLLIWIYLFCFVKNKIDLKKMIFVMFIAIIGFFFITSIGAGRVSSNVEFVGIGEYFNNFASTLGSSLSEFGSAVNTLVIGIRYTPSEIPYGYGLSFVVAVVSCIPLLVAHIPLLADKALFLNQLPGSVYHSLGGSYLGELFYNFGWLGCIACMFIGIVMNRAHLVVNKKDSDYITTSCFYAVISTAMFLYVRGYITDMGQKLIWLYIVLYCIRCYENKNRNSKKI